MTGRKKRHSIGFKAQVALEVVKQTGTLAELSGTFQVHSGRVSKWKKQLLFGIESLFLDAASTTTTSAQQSRLIFTCRSPGS